MTLDVEDQLKERILEYVKSYHARHGMPPSLSRVCKHFHTHYKRVKALFPGGAVDVYTEAGVPVPKERIKKTEKAMRTRMMKVARRKEAKAKAEGKPPPAKESTPTSATLLRLSSLLDVTLDALFKVMVFVQAPKTRLTRESIDSAIDETARGLLEAVGKLDPEYARDVIERQSEEGYLGFLEGNVLDFCLIRDEELSELGLKRRHAWMDLLKRYHPKLLAELISPSE